ncbi:MAG: restriction endonuclease, partial [Clostridia bacterium]|nr:restriction endonuclease [Clostridia bacterium]
LGRWWGNDAKKKKQVEIDIMGEADKNSALFGECKWTNEKIDVGILDTLIYRSQLFSYRHTHLYLFSKSGFTDGCIEKASNLNNVSLVAYDDILQSLKK